MMGELGPNFTSHEGGFRVEGFQLAKMVAQDTFGILWSYGFDTTGMIQSMLRTWALAILGTQPVTSGIDVPQ